MNIENLILRRKTELDLTNSEIAGAMSASGGDKISPEAVGHYFTGEAGVPIRRIGPFLTALGLKVIREDEKTVSTDKLAALNVLALEALHIQGRDSRRSLR